MEQPKENEEIPLHNKQQAEYIFKMYDTNLDGKISPDELKQMIKDNEKDETVAQIMKEIDANNDGHLDPEEFAIVVNDRRFRHHFNHAFKSYVNTFVPMRDGQRQQKYNCWPLALSMMAISAIELITFSIDATEGKTEADGSIANNLVYDPHRRYEVWRFITYMFVHVGWVHLISNIIMQIILGLPLELVHGWWRVLIVYLAGVIGGSFSVSIIGSTNCLAGASGGVYAVLTAHIVTVLMNHSKMKYIILHLLLFFCFVALDIGLLIYNQYYTDADRYTVNFAHVGGVVAGLLIGIGVLKNFEVERWETILWYCSRTIYCILFIISIIINIYWTDIYQSDEVE